MEISIRQAEKRDLVHILKLHVQPDMDNGNVLNLKDADKIFNKMKSYPNYKIYVAESESQVIGTFSLLIMDNLAHMGAPSGLIEDVVVSTSFQGKGVGRQMMEFAINKCKEKGCYKVALSSNLKRVNAHHLSSNTFTLKRSGYYNIFNQT